MKEMAVVAEMHKMILFRKTTRMGNLIELGLVQFMILLFTNPLKNSVSKRCCSGTAESSMNLSLSSISLRFPQQQWLRHHQ